MKEFTELSGPWTGFSTQRRLKINETIRLLITKAKITGEGSDADGKFHLTGSYDPASQRVMLTRRYSWTVEPTQSSVGIAFDYEGRWDGAMVSGTWQERDDAVNRGTFEMWPDREEDREGLRIEIEKEQPAPLPG